MICPAREQLVALMDGLLAEAEAAELGRHIDECSHCQSELDQLCPSDVIVAPSNEQDTFRSVDRVAVQRLLAEMCQRSELATQMTATGDESTPVSGVHLLPMRIRNYELQALIGEGATGHLFRARDLSLTRTVAIKLLKPQFVRGSDTWQRFVREARAAAGLRSDHVVTVFDVDEGSAECPPFLVMEFIAGGSLAKRIKAVPQRLGVEWVMQAARGLAAAHAAGIVHRDIKPSNLLLDEVSGRVKIADFGLARWEDASEQLTATGMLAGTPSYMSPEQINDPSSADALSDLYSLGVVLYEVLTRELPFRGSTRRILEQVLHDEPIAPRLLNDDVSRDIETVCLKAMSKERGLRYGSLTELADDLQCWLNGLAVVARPIGPVRRMGRWIRRNPLTTGAAFIVALVLAGGFVDWVGYRRRQESMFKPRDTVTAVEPVVANRQQPVVGVERARVLQLLVELADQPAESPEQYRSRARILNVGLDALSDWIGHDDQLPETINTAAACCRVGEAAMEIGRTHVARQCLRRAEPLARAVVKRDSHWTEQRTWLRCLIHRSDVEDELLQRATAEELRRQAVELGARLLTQALDSAPSEQQLVTSNDADEPSRKRLLEAARDWSAAAERTVNINSTDWRDDWARPAQTAMARLTAVAEQHPDDAGIQWTLALLESRYAAVCYGTERAAARRLMQQALRRFDQLLRTESARERLWFDVARTTWLAARTRLFVEHDDGGSQALTSSSDNREQPASSLRLNDDTEPLRWLTPVRDQLEAAVRLNPASVLWRREFAHLLATEGRSLAVTTGRSSEAASLHQRAAQEFEGCGTECWSCVAQAIDCEIQQALIALSQRAVAEQQPALDRAMRLFNALELAVQQHSDLQQAAAERIEELRSRCGNVQRLMSRGVSR